MKQLITFLPSIIFLNFLLPQVNAVATDNRALKPSTAIHATGKRIALIIGNGNYQHTDRLPKLANPSHDSEDIAQALRGFALLPTVAAAGLCHRKT